MGNSGRMAQLLGYRARTGSVRVLWGSIVPRLRHWSAGRARPALPNNTAPMSRQLWGSAVRATMFNVLKASISTPAGGAAREVALSVEKGNSQTAVSTAGALPTPPAQQVRT